MLKWLRQLIGSDGAPAPGAARQESAPEPGPLPGQKWIYVTATGCDVASAVRSIEGVLKVTRSSGGYWCIVADRDVVGEAARMIVSKGGNLTMLVTPESLAELKA